MTPSRGKLLATADLHYALYPAGDVSTESLARRVCESDADVFIIAGDIADVSFENLAVCLRLFDGFAGLKLLVPGNHDLWTTCASSLDRYRDELPAVARACGFHVLDKEPVSSGGVGFIGNIGWYDYSFRNPDLPLSTEDYRRKTVPGLCTWNDSVYIHWDLDDEDFTERCLRKLRRHYELVERGCREVVAVLHHLPFSELLYGPASMAHEFCRAYMGSSRFGSLLLRCKKVRYVICGHRHGVAVHRKGRLTAFVAGSEPGKKRLLELDLATGRHNHLEFAPSPGCTATSAGPAEEMDA